jgi:hypothetical protein
MSPFTTFPKLPEDFKQSAREAREQMLKSGKGYAADEVRIWLRALLRGKPAVKPQPKRWLF